MENNIELHLPTPQATSAEDENQIIGRILQGVGGLYTVRITAAGNAPVACGEVVSCRARGSFRHNNISPLPGDNVILLRADARESEIKGGNEDGIGFVIDKIAARKNMLIRPPMANLDYLFITMASAAPSPILPTIDKLISIAEFNHIEPVIVITKSELSPEYALELSALYSSCGFTVFSLSALSGVGIAPLKEFVDTALCGRTAAFAGASGIGKSTLLNRLFPHLCLSTSEISRKIQRGKHTTRKVELYPLSDDASCGYIADTPGFSMLDFERFDFFELEDLPLTMREFVPYIGKCRYTKCSHTKEEGCAIVQAVKQRVIPASRHQSFCTLYQTLKAKKKWQ